MAVVNTEGKVVFGSEEKVLTIEKGCCQSLQQLLKNEEKGRSLMKECEKTVEYLFLIQLDHLEYKLNYTAALARAHL